MKAMFLDSTAQRVPSYSKLPLPEKLHNTYLNFYSVQVQGFYTVQERLFWMALKKENWGRAFAFDYEPFLIEGWKKVDYSRDFFSIVLLLDSSSTKATQE